MGPLDIASRRELFVDHFLIDRLDGAALRPHPPQRREIVFQVAGPLENACSGVYSVFVQHEGRILLYYRGRYPPAEESNNHAEDQTAHVAFSTDGLHFERPRLGLFDLGDGGANNVIWRGRQAHNLVPFLDGNPAAAHDARFKAVGGSGQRRLYALVSPDGIHWRLAQDEPLEIDGAFDSANVPMWDPLHKTYRLFSRYFHRADGQKIRAIQSCQSKDFLHWTPPAPHQYADGPPREHFYTNATVLCPGAEHILLSFPMRFVPHRRPPVNVDEMDYTARGGVSDAVMLTSRDGVHWDRSFPQAWLRAGPDERNWTHRNQVPAVGILPAGPTEWSMYVSEHYGWPDNRLRRLAVRPWGLAAVHAGPAGGELLTHPLVFAGRELRLNLATAAAGSVAVEIQDPAGRAIPPYAMDDMAPMYGDRIEAPVAWPGREARESAPPLPAAGTDLSPLAGRPVRLRVRLHDADLFALRFAE